MSRQQGMSSLAMVLLVLVLGTLLLTGLNQQLTTYGKQVSGESLSVRHQASVQSALEWGRVQRWLIQPEAQCRQVNTSRVCLRRLNESRVLLIVGSNDLLLWRTGTIAEGQILFSPRGWSDFCPLKERSQCQLP